jgi:hypothetical protein
MYDILALLGCYAVLLGSYRLLETICLSHLHLSSCGTHCISVTETDQYVLCKVSRRLYC